MVGVKLLGSSACYSIAAAPAGNGMPRNNCRGEEIKRDRANRPAGRSGKTVRKVPNMKQAKQVQRFVKN